MVGAAALLTRAAALTDSGNCPHGLGAAALLTGAAALTDSGCLHGLESPIIRPGAHLWVERRDGAVRLVMDGLAATVEPEAVH